MQSEVGHWGGVVVHDAVIKTTDEVAAEKPRSVTINHDMRYWEANTNDVGSFVFIDFSPEC